MQDPAELTAFKAVQHTFRRFAGHGLDNLSIQQDLLAKFRHRCAVCNQYHTSDKLLKAHWKMDHSTAFLAHAHDDLYQDLLTRALAQQSDDTPCIYCDKRTKKKHHDCILLRNLAMLAASDDLTDIPICATPERLLRCTLCDRSFLTQNGLTMHMHKKHNVADAGVIPFLVERDCLPNDCGQAFETMTSVERHIRSGNCQEFDANLPICTMMTINDHLKRYVEQDDLAGLLKDPTMLQLLYLQCGLCQQKFRYRGNLGNPLASRHAIHVNAVKHEVIRTDEYHRGRSLTCYCPDKKEARTHRCVIFQQFAILKHSISSPHHLDDPTPNAEMVLQALGDIVDEETDKETEALPTPTGDISFQQSDGDHLRSLSGS